MPLNKSDVFKLNTAYFFWSETPDQPQPTAADIVSGPAAITALGYEIHIGYTSSEQALEVENEGGTQSGDADGPLQNPSLFPNDNSTAEVNAFVLKVWEWATKNFELAFGKNAVKLPNGAIGKHRFPQPMTGTFLAVFVTVEGATFIHAPSASIIGTSAFGAIGGVGSYGDIPLRITPEFHAEHDTKFYVLPLDAVSA